jgi:GNAT superfamily N-acetyltransferase
VDEQDFTPARLRLMQGLTQQVAATRPDLVNTDATVGELAWVYGKDHGSLGGTWRHRLWFDGDTAVGWGWIFLPYRVVRSDGKPLEVKTANLAWQVRPDRPGLFDEILDWYDDEAAHVERATTARAVNEHALGRLAAHGFTFDAKVGGDDGFWVQLNARDLVLLDDPVLPSGFRFRTADQVGPMAAVKAHRDAWHPSSFTEQSFEGVRVIWPYRSDLHVLVEAPDGTMAATAIIWLDEQGRTAEFEPVGTHQQYRRQGLGTALLRFGMLRARDAGADRMLVTCLGAPAYAAARELYYGVGFTQLTRDVPHIKPAG